MLCLGSLFFQSRALEAAPEGRLSLSSLTRGHNFLNRPPANLLPTVPSVSVVRPGVGHADLECHAHCPPRVTVSRKTLGQSARSCPFHVAGRKRGWCRLEPSLGHRFPGLPGISELLPTMREVPQPVLTCMGRRVTDHSVCCPWPLGPSPAQLSPPPHSPTMLSVNMGESPWGRGLDNAARGHGPPCTAAGTFPQSAGDNVGRPH